MKKLFLIMILCSGCGAGKIVTQPPVKTTYKFTRIAIVNKDNSAKAGAIYKIVK